MDRIERLKRRVDASREERERYARLNEEKRDREKMIRDAFPRTRMGFWCEKCAQDFEGVAYKEVSQVFVDPPCAWYVGFCPKNHKAIRRITDKAGDPYYRQSALIRRQRIELADAMLTPDNPRFRVVYPAQWRKLEEERQKREEMQVAIRQ